MRRVAITGGTGQVGRQAHEALDDQETTPMARSEVDDLDVVELDVSDRERFREVLDGFDVLVHLAANPSPDADWDDVVDPNIEGAYNAYHAAVAHELDRVVFASSNHAIHMDNAADPSDPESLCERPRTVTPRDPPRADSFYGVSKVAGEALGTYFADRHDIEVISLRIGWLMDEDELRETQSESADRARFARAMYLSPRDCRDAVRRAVTSSIDDSPLTLHVVSRNDDRYFSITDTCARIGYRPRDNATEVLEQ